MSEQAVTTQLTGADRALMAPPATRPRSTRGDDRTATTGHRDPPGGPRNARRGVRCDRHRHRAGTAPRPPPGSCPLGPRHRPRSEQGGLLRLLPDFNILLRLRRRALEQGKLITVRSVGDAVFQLFSITGTLPLFTVDGRCGETAVTSEADGTGRAPDASPDARPTVALPLGADITPSDTDQDLRIEVAQLRRAMQTRPVIDLARGVIMASFELSAEDSWRRYWSRSPRTPTPNCTRWPTTSSAPSPATHSARRSASRSPTRSPPASGHCRRTRSALVLAPADVAPGRNPPPPPIGPRAARNRTAWPSTCAATWAAHAPWSDTLFQRHRPASHPQPVTQNHQIGESEQAVRVRNRCRFMTGIPVGSMRHDVQDLRRAQQQGPVEQFGVLATLSRWRPRVQIPSGPLRLHVSVKLRGWVAQLVRAIA